MPHEPHFQSSYHNAVHGGFNRHFRGWLPTTVENPVFSAIIRWCLQQISPNPAQGWRIQAHQFRIRTTAAEIGKPTPEGVHKDGADYILIMLLDRHNVEGGVSHIFDNERQPLAQCTLQDSGDLLLINDKAVYHGVTPITVQQPDKPAWRDVLVLTFHRLGS
ncbi:MAG: 2OG-Fe dioxygenase family protein [Thiolinea sp.]